MKTRQVERAEFRAEMKRGARRRRQKTREERQVDLENRKTQSSTLRIKAMSAVSKLSQFVGKPSTAK